MYLTWWSETPKQINAMMDSTIWQKFEELIQTPEWKDLIRVLMETDAGRERLESLLNPEIEDGMRSKESMLEIEDGMRSKESMLEIEDGMRSKESMLEIEDGMRSKESMLEIEDGMRSKESMLEIEDGMRSKESMLEKEVWKRTSYIRDVIDSIF